MPVNTDFCNVITCLPAFAIDVDVVTIDAFLLLLLLLLLIILVELLTGDPIVAELFGGTFNRTCGAIELPLK